MCVLCGVQVRSRNVLLKLCVYIAKVVCVCLVWCAGVSCVCILLKLCVCLVWCAGEE